MTILLVLIPLGVLLLAVAIAFFVWAVHQGQFEDLEGEGSRILFSDDRTLDPRKENKTRTQESEDPCSNR